MLGLYQVIQDVGLSRISSRQVAEVQTNMDEVAVFLKLKTVEPEPAPALLIEEVQENSHGLPKQEPKGFIARLFGKMRHHNRR